MKNAQWIIRAKEGLDGLELQNDVPIPELGPTDCLVKIDAVALNYRDIAIPTGKYPLYWNDSVIPTSDGAGTILATGNSVTLHKIGDEVCTLFTQAHQTGLFDHSMRQTTLGSAVNGPLRRYAVYEEKALVPGPRSLSGVEAATLPCAGVTAWNALNGLADRAVKAGDVVLVQGTGGVALFALQFALASGATVIATTSSEKKERKVKELGAHHVINYRKDPNWGETAKRLAGGSGVTHVIEVGGHATMAQSLKAIRPEGVIAMIGFLGGMGNGDDPSRSAGLMEAFTACAILRPIMVGSKELFVAMNSFIDEHHIHPTVDPRVFDFKDAREAYEYMIEQDFFGKIVIRVGQ